MKPSLVLLVVLAFIGCNRYYHFNSKLYGHQPHTADHVLEIDSTYELYIRHVYKNSRGNRKTYKTNLEQEALASDTLIEVEHLLLSKEKDVAIYLTSIPDKYQRYYANHYAGDSLINIYDLQKFCIGRYVSNRIDFVAKNEKFKDTWSVNFRTTNGNRYMLLTLIEEEVDQVYDKTIRIDRALEEGVGFKRVTVPYRFMFDRHETTNTTKAYLKDSRILLNRSGMKYEVLFPLTTADTVYFYDDRITYKPF